MSFELKIIITGMCLFVPEPSTGCVHVLLVNYTGHGPKDHHHARLVYDKAYRKKGTPPSNDYTCEDLTGSVLSLLEKVGSAELDLPDQIVNLNEIARNGRLDPKWVKVDPKLVSKALHARVTLGAGSATCDPDKGDVYELPPTSRVQRLATAVDWNLTVPGDDLSGWGSTPLYPIGGQMELRIYNATKKGLPPVVPDDEWKAMKKGMLAQHFHGYYQLYEDKHKPVPKRAADASEPDLETITRCDCATLKKQQQSSAMLSLHTVNCIKAKASLSPAG